MEIIVKQLDGLKHCQSFCNDHGIKLNCDVKDYIYFDDKTCTSVKGYKITYNYEHQDLGYYDYRYHENHSKLSLNEIQQFKENGMQCAFCNKRIARSKIYFIKNDDQILTLGNNCYKNIDLKSYYPNANDSFIEDRHYRITNFKLSQLIDYVENFENVYIPANIAFNLLECKTPKMLFSEYVENHDLKECSNEKLNCYINIINNFEVNDFNDSIKRIINDPLGIHIEATGKILSVLFNIKENSFKQNVNNVDQLKDIECKLVFIKCYQSFSQFNDVTYKHIFTSDIGNIVWYTTSNKLLNSINKQFILSAKNFNIKNDQIQVKRPSLKSI